MLCHQKSMDSLRNKFRGCMVGALMGDCLGVPYEGITSCKLDDILQYFDRLRSGNYAHKLVHMTTDGKMVYSDDTAMARVVAKSLIAKRGYDAQDMASRFTKTFLKKPNIGYGQNVQLVFLKWKKNPKDVYEPAREQFEGRGSFGNGAAMRIAPVALFAYDNNELMLDIAKQSSLLTHYCREGYNGALLQVMAVRLALGLDPLDAFSVDDFINQLVNQITVVENTPSVGKESESAEVYPHTYADQLQVVRRLASKDSVDLQEIVDQLGHEIRAQRSVGTAIYIFLRSMKPIAIFPYENCMERAMALTIRVGGDVDTIGTMACAIAGAYYGVDAIPAYVRNCCDKMDSTISLADQLFKRHSK